MKFFSVDKQGNAETVQSQLIQIGSNPDPVIAAAGDIACDPTAPAFNGGDGSATDCRAKGTSNLLVGADAVLPIGDDQYECGGPSAFAQAGDTTVAPATVQLAQAVARLEPQAKVRVSYLANWAEGTLLHATRDSIHVQVGATLLPLPRVRR